MDLLHLQYFIIIAETQHITKAANLLHISQPSLSGTLARIEKELDVQLFERHGRNIVLNDYGKIFLHRAKNIFRELENLHTEIDTLKGSQTNTIAIGAVSPIYTKNWLLDFLRNYPDIKLFQSIDPYKKLDQQLSKGEIEFAITDSPSVSSDYASYLLGEEEYLILAPLDSPISADKPQDFSVFANEPFICSPKAEDLLRPIDILSQSVNIEPNIIFEGDPYLLSNIFTLNYGYLIFGTTVLSDNDYSDFCKNFKIIRLSNECAHRKVHLLWDKNRIHSQAAETFINFIKTQTKQFHFIEEPSTKQIDEVLHMRLKKEML